MTSTQRSVGKICSPALGYLFSAAEECGKTPEIKMFVDIASGQKTPHPRRVSSDTASMDAVVCWLAFRNINYRHAFCRRIIPA